MDIEAIRRAAQRCVDAKAAYMAATDPVDEERLLSELEEADEALDELGEAAPIIIEILNRFQRSSA